MRKLLALVTVAVVVLAGCNTVRGTVNGLGKDTQKAGEWVQEKVPANPQ